MRSYYARRAAAGVNLNGNYTWGYCVGNTTPSGQANFSSGYLKPDDPGFDRGNCEQNRTHIANLTLGVQSPEFGNPALRAIASSWRVSGIVNARSGSWLTVTTGRDPAFTGIPGQRPDQVLANPYTGDKSLNSYLNRDAFALPASGTLGNHPNRSFEGPGFWTIDVSLAPMWKFTGNPLATHISHSGSQCASPSEGTASQATLVEWSSVAKRRRPK